YTTPTASHTDPLPPPPTHPSLEISGGGKDLFLPALKTIHRPYAAFPFIASNRHIETIFASFFRSTPDVKFKRECLRTKLLKNPSELFPSRRHLFLLSRFYLRLLRSNLYRHQIDLRRWSFEYKRLPA
ncbi:hypothetical protein LINPERPRIM_LOCUS39507, partial [Linum perenne]